MIIKKNLTTWEAIDYAKKNGFNKEMFRLNINEKYVASGKFLDAYYEFIVIPIIGNGFITFKQLCEEYGDRNISIDIVDEEEFKNGVWADFIIHNKEVPEEYQLTDNQ